jgi:hypothetical protein
MAMKRLRAAPRVLKACHMGARLKWMVLKEQVRKRPPAALLAVDVVESLMGQLAHAPEQPGCWEALSVTGLRRHHA